ncbi:cytochrome P450 [Russula emetica]|nr:cytochrome P450 [Russula emetica]
MPLTSLLACLLVLPFVLALQASRDYRRRRGLPYPPGPRPLPIIGNVLDIPAEFSWLLYTQLAKKYGLLSSELVGDVMSFHILGRVVVILGSTKSTKDLLEKRGEIYSDRPVIPFFEIFQSEQMLAMTYGYEARGHHDSTIEAAKKLSDLGTRASLPGSLLINEFPFRMCTTCPRMDAMDHRSAIGHSLAEQVTNDPMRFVRESMLNGTAPRSIALDNLVEAEKRGSEREGYEKAITETLGTMYTVGTDSMVSSIMSLFLALLLHPEVQKKAQHEIDAVTGRERFPIFDDRRRLPFVNALCKEVLRWRPAAPLRAWLIGNIWAITRDPDVYPEPEVFKPERFLSPNGTLRDDVTLASVFGFGKRVCPGRHFVDTTLFMAAATVLSVFRIERRHGTEGVPFDYTYSGGLVSPRDKRAEELIIRGQYDDLNYVG